MLCPGPTLQSTYSGWDLPSSSWRSTLRTLCPGPTLQSTYSGWDLPSSSWRSTLRTLCPGPTLQSTYSGFYKTVWKLTHGCLEEVAKYIYTFDNSSIKHHLFDHYDCTNGLLKELSKESADVVETLNLETEKTAIVSGLQISCRSQSGWILPAHEVVFYL